jgi:hypothetical protein
MLTGYKTYITAAAMILTAIAGYVNGQVDPFIALQTILGALGIGFLRNGIKTG